MARIEDEEVEVPGESDENVGDEGTVRKREKKRKSKEERIAERRVVFWTLLIVLVITLGFWLAPKIGSLMRGEPVFIETENKSDLKPSVEKQEKKNYMEITL